MLSTSEILALPPSQPTDWIVDGLIRAGRKRPSLLCGLPEAGKSTLAHQLALAVANGVPFLDRATVQGHVILWKNEDSPQDIREDLVQAGLVNTSELSIILPKPGDDNQTILLRSLVERPDTRLVVIETLADFMKDSELEKSKDMRDALDQFANSVCALHPNTAFLLLAHYNKSTNEGLSLTRINGSTFIPAGTDAKLYLEQVSDKDSRRIFHATVRKGKRIEPTFLIFDPNTLNSTLGRTVADEVAQAKKGLAELRIIELDTKIEQLLRESPDIPKMTLVKKVGGAGAATKDRIDQLIESGFILTKKGGDKGNAILLRWNGIAGVSDDTNEYAKGAQTVQ